MKLLIHFAVIGFSNTYLLGQEDGGDGILIDPGKMDIPLLNMIENNKFYIKTILLTHAHKEQIGGLDTILKIYNAEIYSISPHINSFSSNKIKEGQIITKSGIDIEIIELPGHSSDSVIYKIDNMLFTGDSLLAGQIGVTQNSYLKANLQKSIQTKLLKYDDNMLVFPGQGPPTTMKAIKLFNIDL